MGGVCTGGAVILHLSRKGDMKAFDVAEARSLPKDPISKLVEAGGQRLHFFHSTGVI